MARPTGKTDASKDVVILAKERRIKELEEALTKTTKNSAAVDYRVLASHMRRATEITNWPVLAKGQRQAHDARWMSTSTQKGSTSS